MAEKQIIDLLSLEILPLAKGMLKGAFTIKEESSEFAHLITWLKTLAWYSQQEKKSKTYIATYNSEKIAYITISNGLLEQEIDGIQNNTKNYKPQVLLIGKLYVSPKYRDCGIGRKLLSFALDIAANLDGMIGCLGIIVDSNSNLDTIKFYKKFGFIEIDKEGKEEERTLKMFFKLSSA